MKIFWRFFFVLFFTQPTGAQNPHTIDSLQNVLQQYDANKAAKNLSAGLRDSVKVNILQNLMRIHVDTKPEIALTYCLQMLDLSEKINYKKGIGYAHLYMGRIYNRQGEHQQAIAELDKSAVTFFKMKDDMSLSKSYSELGIVFSKLGNFPESIRYNLASLKIVEKQDDLFAIATSQLNIGILYKQHGDYDKALGYYNATLKTANKMTANDKGFVQMYVYNSIGQAYLKQGKNNEAMAMLQRALEMSKRYGDAFIDADINLAIGNCYFAKGDMPKALEGFNRSLELNIQNGSQTGISECYLQIGRANFKLGQMSQALTFTNKALDIAKKTDQKEFIRDAYAILSEIYKATQNYKSAYENQVLFKQANDSLFNEDKNKKLTELQLTYEFEKRQAKAKAAQQKKYDKVVEEGKKQQAVNYTIFGVLLVVSIIAIIIYRSLRRNQRQKRLIENQNEVIQQSLTEKETLLREIHHRVKNNLQIISSLLNIQSEDIQDANVLSSIQEGQSRVEAMSLIHQNLYQSEHLNNVDIENYMKGLVQYLSKMFRGDSESVSVTIETSDIRFDIDTAIPLGLIVNELVSNAYKYAFDANEKGKINISIKAKNDTDYELNITNDGKPLPPDFDPKKSNSLGLKLVSILSRQLRGRFSSYSDNGLTSFIVDFKDLKTWHASN